MKKLLAMLLAVIMVVALAAPACAADDEIIINFPSVWVGTDSKAPYMTQLIEAFNEENAGSIKVVVEEQTDYQAARDKLRTTITTGETPDLCIMDTTYDIKGYSEAGKFMDLTPYLEEGWGDDFAEGAFDAWSVDGKVYALPFESAIFTPIYNTKIFNEIGWDHFPATYDEFFQFCKDAKAKGFNAMGQMAGDNAWSSMLWYSLIVEAIGGKDVYADGLQNPAFVQAAEVLKEMYEYTFDGALSATAGDVNGHWLNRDTAIYLNGPWWIGNLYKEDNAVDGVLLADDCDVAVNPKFEGGKGDGGLVTTVQGFLAAAKQDDPAKEAAVVKFLQYVTDPAHVSELALSSGAMFFVKYTPSPETSVISQKFTEIANNANYTVLHVNGAFPTAFSTAFPTAVQELISGSLDAQGFVDYLQTEIDNAA
jgi:raffinose/stachyose/melibiose transport system substrate-binding protein